MRLWMRSIMRRAGCARSNEKKGSDMAAGDDKKPQKGMRQGLATYGDAGFSLFLRKAFLKAGGYTDDALDRPIVGITNTFSDYNPCHGNVPDLIEAVKRGVMLAGVGDKTLPAQLMAAASVDRPAVVLPGGPMLVGHFKGEVLGACTDCRRLWGQFRAGTFSQEAIDKV